LFFFGKKEGHKEKRLLKKKKRNL